MGQGGHFPKHLLSRYLLTPTHIDCSYSLVGSRVEDILSLYPQGTPGAVGLAVDEDLLDKLHCFVAPTLSHLLALLLHPSEDFPPNKTGLIVVDSISTLFATAFPKVTDPIDGKQPTGKTKDILQWAASRKWSIMGDFVSKLGKLAITRNIAVLMTSQTMTKVRAETDILLRPAAHGKSWDAGIATRIVLFRDWPCPGSSEDEEVGKFRVVRYAGVQKAGGTSHGDDGGVGKVIAFTITNVSYGRLYIPGKIC